jgi:hypothetical protein
VRSNRSRCVAAAAARCSLSHFWEKKATQKNYYTLENPLYDNQRPNVSVWFFCSTGSQNSCYISKNDPKLKRSNEKKKIKKDE